METGWGWVRADWTSAVSRREDQLTERRAGYSHFLIEAGHIRRHRSIVRKVPNETAGAATSTPEPISARPPTRPIVGVGAVVFVESGGVVLVKRRHEPLAGQWSLPGGRLELGESLQAGTAREIHEETGLVVDVGPVVDVFDRILLDELGGVRHHFVLVDFLCRPRAGTLVAGSDVVDVCAVRPADVASYRVAPKAQAVIDRAVEMWGTVTW
jgi:ADP-ribose pyrophosphatase YjhB (NUDIX family)